MRLAFAFDFDGVILDSLPALKKTYFDFLARYGQEGTELEFSSLNGPSLPEIVSQLKHKYQLLESNEDLLQRYKSCLRTTYLEATLVAGARECLTTLKSRGFFLALVTSSLRTEVHEILDKHRISDLFDFILTGDEFHRSKPSPEIYSKIREKFPHYSFWAIEDSHNGLLSAKEAGLRTVYFDPHGTGTDLKVDCRISSLVSLDTRVNELVSFCCVIEHSSDIEISISEGHFPAIADEENRRIETIWQSALKQRSLTDESVLYYQSHISLENKLVIKAFWGSYRFFFARQTDPSLDIPFVPLAVSGICVNGDDQVLIGRRRNVAEYLGYLEFVPSGGINGTSAGGATLDYRNQLKEEFVEETGFDISSISFVKPLGLIKDFKNQVVDICCLIQVKTSLSKVLQHTLEYEELSWIEQSAVEVESFVPTSIALLNLFKHHKLCDTL